MTAGTFKTPPDLQNGQPLFAREDLVVLLLLFTGTFVLYWQSFGFAWTYDDFPVIVNNPDILSFQNFLKDSYPGRPLRELSFLLDYSLFGLEPRWWHLQQIFWHAINGGLIYLLVRMLGGGLWLGFLSSTIFLGHPIQAEVVANLSHRKDILALAFMLASTCCYIRGCRTGKGAAWFACALAAWGLSLLAKENAVVVPIVVLLYEMLFLPKEQRVMLRFPGIAAGLLCAVVVGFTAYFVWSGAWEQLLKDAPKHLNAMNYPRGTVADYFRTVFKSWAFMVRNYFIPVSLAPEYVFEVPGRWSDLWVISGIGCGVSWLAGLVAMWRRLPLSAFFWGWLGILWLPTSNLLPLSYFLADRYWYAPSVGLVVVIVGTLLAMTRPLPSFAKAIAAIVCLALLLSTTWRQMGYWKDSLSLWTHAVEVSPDSSGAVSHLGVAYLDSGDAQKAIETLRKSALNFNSATSYYHLAAAYEKTGDIRSAIRYYCFFIKSSGYAIGVDKGDLRLYLKKNYGVDCD